MRKLSILIVFATVVINVVAQKNVSRNNLVWLGDFTNAKLNDKWSIYLDFGFRRKEWLNQWSQVLVRPGLTYNFNKSVSASAGVCYFSHYAVSYIRPEYRGWQQLLFSENYGRARVNHRIRAEQRFNQKVVSGQLAEGYSYNNRFRYQLALQVALNKTKIEDKTVYISLADEVMVNSGKEIRTNYFDQNRLSAGLGYRWNDRLNVLVSYMNNFIQRAKVDSFENNNVLVINIYHILDFSRKSTKEIN